MDIYIDALTGNDTTGDGTVEKPYKTLLTVLKSKLVKTGVNYNIFLGEGEYIIDNPCFYNYANCQMVIEGKSEKTKIYQQNDSIGGFTFATFILTFRKLVYNINETLQSANLNTFKMQWNLYNVVFDRCPNNPYGVFLPLEGATITFRNCIKTKNTTNLFRLTNGNAKVYDSYGAFTSGLSTTQSQWDAGGNVITATPQYDPVTFSITNPTIGDSIGVYSGQYSWKNTTIKHLIYHNNLYKTINESNLNTWIELGSTTPTVQQIKDSGFEKLSLLDRVGQYSPLDLLAGDLELLTWTDDTTITNLDTMLSVTQNNQLVYPTKDIDINGVETLDAVVLTASANTKVAISFDSGLTYKAYLNGTWQTVDTAENGMTTSQINALTVSQLSEGRGESNTVRFSYFLNSTSTVDKIQLKVTLMGYDAVAKTTDYELRYTQSERKISYLIKKSGTYSVSYVDGQLQI